MPRWRTYFRGHHSAGSVSHRTLRPPSPSLPPTRPPTSAGSTCWSTAAGWPIELSRLQLRFISGPDIEQMALTRTDIFEAVTGAVRAQGNGEVVVEPRVHLTPPNGGRGHLNILRAHLGPAPARA